MSDALGSLWTWSPREYLSEEPGLAEAARSAGFDVYGSRPALLPGSPLMFVNAKEKTLAVSGPEAVTVTEGVPTLPSTVADGVPKPAAAPGAPGVPGWPGAPSAPQPTWLTLTRKQNGKK